MNMYEFEKAQINCTNQLQKITDDYMKIYNQLNPFFRNLESKLSLLGSDRQALSSLLSRYDAAFTLLRELKADLNDFQSLDEEEKRMAHMLAAHDLSLVSKFFVELQLQLAKTTLGKETLERIVQTS